MSLPDLETLEPFSPELTDDYLEHHAVLPLGFEEGRLVVATWQDEVDAQALDDLRLLAGAPVELVRLPEPELDAEERAALGKAGAKIRILPFLKGFSTTDLIRRVKAAGDI